MARRITASMVRGCARAALRAYNFSERVFGLAINRINLDEAWSARTRSHLSWSRTDGLWNAGDLLLLMEAARRARQSSRSPLTTSIIVPVYNEAAYTLQCLRSLLPEVNLDENEIIVVNNASQDETSRLLSQLTSFITVINNESNRGFGEGCNQGGQVARGRHLIFLNNDTLVLPGWLRGLVETVKCDPEVGAVGSHLFNPDGTTQEAGAIIWRDGATELCGSGAFPSDVRFNFRREVDYCSGASLLVRKELFEQVGGFDPRYAPAYYEDADLCMAVRSLGFKVVYQPASRIIHYSGVTSRRAMATNVKSTQLINRQKFVAKWGVALAQSHFPYTRANVSRAMNRNETA